MKKIFKYTFVGLLAGGMLLTTSCSESQIETAPTRSMSGQGLLANGNAALVALNGIYREMYTAGWSTTGRSYAKHLKHNAALHCKEHRTRTNLNLKRP